MKKVSVRNSADCELKKKEEKSTKYTNVALEKQKDLGI